MPPLAIAAGIAAVGSIGGAAISSSANKKAVKTQAAASQQASQAQAQGQTQALQYQTDNYNRNAAVLAPWQQQGLQANALVGSALGFGGAAGNVEAKNAFDTFRDSTGYNFQMDEALRGVNSNYAGAGVLQSGAALGAISDRAGQVAQGSFQGWLGNVDTIANRGFGAASAQAGVGQNFANNASSIATSGANNQASLAINNANNQSALQLQQGQNIGSTIGALGQIGGYVAGNALNPQQNYGYMPQQNGMGGYY